MRPGSSAISFLAAVSVMAVVLMSIVYLYWGEPLIVFRDYGVAMLLARCGSEIYLRFNNSVTGSPVDIVFRYCGSIEGLYMATDSAGYDYYSMGLVDVNRSVSSYSKGYMAFCSEFGGYVEIGGLALQAPPGSCIVVMGFREAVKMLLKRSPDLLWISIPT